MSWFPIYSKRSGKENSESYIRHVWWCISLQVLLHMRDTFCCLKERVLVSELRSIVAGQVINEWEGDEGVVLILFLGVLFVISMFGIINLQDSPFDNV